MKIQKMKFDGMDTFNDYKVEMSFGQLVAIRNALEKDHSDPLSDEIYAELNYYLENIPGPGESSDEFKSERDAAKKAKDDAGEQVNPEDAGPASDTELEAGEGGALPPPPSDEDEFGGAMGDTGPEGSEGEGEFHEGPKLSSQERDVIDRSMDGGPSARPSGVSHVPPPPTE